MRRNKGHEVKVALVAVGAPKMAALAAAIREYEGRISHYFRYEVVEIRGRRLTPGADTARIADEESRELQARVPAGLELVALDEDGERWSSERLADYLGELATLGKPGAAFVIGGPAGLSKALCRTADRVLCLSSFTLPHELARLVLVEQIYRAGTIQRSEPYHRGG
ncbi:MAG: 23S rRNA (pseudouridine(1915)-N(3))-methyltransferase RlmH [Gemmatimonadota bacterium]|nr:MAG: 23S rRNA (pseudouridine(1915)-N(3))-methyltransferase RlmH [Gemmatimonadota bacterium]